MDTANQIKLKCELSKNSQDVYIMTNEEFTDFEETCARRMRWERLKSSAGYVSPAKDSVTAVLQMRELGIRGKIVEKTIAGRRYVIFKGAPQLRKRLRGTRYLANNPQVVALAIGRTGVGHSILSGARLTFYLTAPISVIQALMEDKVTLASVIGRVAGDLIKVGIASTAAILAANSVAALGFVAVGPLVVAIAVGVLVSDRLQNIDDGFGLTEALIRHIDTVNATIYAKTIGKLALNMAKLERLLSWQARNGVRVGKGFFY